MFPNGPENKTAQKDLDIIKRDFTLNGKGELSADYYELKELLNTFAKQYPNTKFILCQMDYSDVNDHEQAYYKSYNIFKKFIDAKPDDLIFPLECDLFLTEKQSSSLLKQAKNLEHNHSLMSNYYQFFESPKVMMNTNRYRRLVYRYGDGFVWGCFKRFDNDIDSKIRAFHYEWIRPDRYFELRILQLSRGFTEAIRDLRSVIRSKPTNLKEALEESVNRLKYNKNELPLSVSDIKLEEHPEHFKKHENFIYYE
jgi:hypothetical protein